MNGSLEHQAFWLWYPGDMELYFAMKQNFGRLERGYTWPAFWKSEGFRNRVVFRKKYQLKEKTSFTFRTAKNCSGFVMVRTPEGETKYPIGCHVEVQEGDAEVIPHLACIACFPCAILTGEMIYTDGTWLAGDYSGPYQKAGYSRYFMDPLHEPSSWVYAETEYFPARKELRTNSAGEKGTLCEFEEELTASYSGSGFFSQQ